MPFKLTSRLQRWSAVLLLVACLVLPVNSVSARSLDDIQEEIDQQNENLNGVKSELSNAEAALRNAEAALSNTQGEIPRLEAEIKQIQAQIEVNRLQISEATETQKLKELEQEEREARQVRAIKSAYQDWRTREVSNPVKSVEEGVKHQVYQAEVSGRELMGLEQLALELSDLQLELQTLDESTKKLETQTVELADKKAAILARIAALRSTVNAQAGAVAGLRTQANIIQSSITQLSQEQKALQQYEAWLLGQSGNGGTNPLTAGQIYFTGRAREYYTGHGVGMSQYGAYGLALNGWGAESILKHYYTGVEVIQYSASDQITIKYCQGEPVHAAFQEGCNGNKWTSGGWVYGYWGPVVEERISLDQYLAGLGEMYDSWPLEARKAQMIAARTYALRYTNNGNPANPICLTTYCQVSYVKSGDQNEMDAVLQTKNLVITYGGALIEALYSADNNNGWGTANNDTVFSSIDGNGTPYGYLRAVQENQGAVVKYPTYGADWGWRTNSYTLGHIDSMLAFAQNDGYLYASSRNYIAAIRATIGQVTAITFERDPSDRVKKVILTGSTGASMPMAGWFFKTVWNSWVDQAQPTGQKDFIYSLTFFLLTAG
ncbi:MAG: hypothetical protein JNK26_01700 [Candidatus Doudnabacteria bacterium]|nr:hypothetical protein [Candidatus Doudnabacteria bacterium]